MTGNPYDTKRTRNQFQKENLALCHANSLPSERCNKIHVWWYMERYDQLHFFQNNRVDHTPLHPKRGKCYIPPSFHHHFGRRWRSLHAIPLDTYAQNIMHAASLHHIDEGCSNIFSKFSNLYPDSICLVRGGDFLPCGFFPSSLCWVVPLLAVMGDLWS